VKSTVLALAAILAVGSPPLFAQQKFAREFESQRAQVAKDSQRWLELGLDQCATELEFDAQKAQRTAEELERSALASEHPVISAAARALLDLARAMREGPAAVQGAIPAPPEASAGDVRARVHFHLATARRAWLEGLPADVLSHSLAAVRLTRELEDDELRLFALWNLRVVTEREAPAYDADLVREIERLSSTRAGARFEPLLRLHEFWNTSTTLPQPDRRATLDAVASLAQSVGDLRVLCQVEWDRAVLEHSAGSPENAQRHLESARVLAEQAGWLREHALTLELAAEVAFESRDDAGYDRFADAAAQQILGRGLPDREIAQAHLRLQVATARADQAAVLAENENLARVRAAERERERGYPDLRERLLASEREHFEQQQRGAQKLEESQARIELVTRVLLLSILAALTAGVFFALRSRRGLKVLNAKLVEEMRRGEAQSKAREEAESRLRRLERVNSLGLVAGGVAHDFNNLMVGVIGNAELLRPGERDPERVQRLDVIRAAGERAARLCAQLQACADEEASLSIERFEVQGLLAEFTPVLAAAVGAGVRVTSAGVAAGLELDADRSQVEQALLNLALNARDAQAHGVSVSASAWARAPAQSQEHVQLGEWADGPYVCIEVRDDGEGMRRELAERIFDPFFSTRFPGRGLGLAVVIGVARRHHAVVRVSSEPGRGSSFQVFFPALGVRATRPEVELTPRAAARVPAMCVLVVDDEHGVRDFLNTALAARGHRLAVAADLDSALAALETLPDSRRTVALVDLTLPVHDGRAVVAALRQRRPALPVVLMSGHSAQHLAEAAASLQVSGAISKPFVTAQLENALAQALGAHTPAEATSSVRS
jgi:two-component system cell cycle sensor histidine kinase/response regulator CckA